MPFAGSTAPQGYLLCDGSAVDRTTYATLFAVIGTTYGAGDGSTTFNVPDLSGRVVIGVSGSHALGTTGGSETVTLTADQLPAHTHVVPQHGHANDIAATMPTLSHTITQAVFKYNAPKKANASSAASASVSVATSTATASRTTNPAVNDHPASACTISGAVTDCQAFDTEAYGTGNAHDNMQAFLTVNYVISVGE